MLRKLIQEENPTRLAICFDRKEPTFRHQKFKDYKAHRKPMPDDLVAQLPGIKDYIRLSNYCLFEMPGYEADDLIGTLARKAEARGYQVFIVTGDKDALQLVDNQIRIYNTHKEGLIYDTQKVEERFDGLGPDKVVEVMALMGDASDNIPGVPGVGEKTAIRLIQEFGSIKKIYQDVDRVKPKSLAESLRENQTLAQLSHDLATIDVEVPIAIDWEALKLRPQEDEKLSEFYKRYEFRTLLKALTPTGEAASGQRRYRTISDEKTFGEFVKELKAVDFFSFDTETTSADPVRAELVGMSFSWKPFEAYYIPVAAPSGGLQGLPVQRVLAELKPILENPEQKKAGQNIKYDWIVMKRAGVNLCGVAFDTMIASYLVNPLKHNHNLDDIAFEYLGVKKITTASVLQKEEKEKYASMAEVPLEKISEYACEDADCVFRLIPTLTEKLKEHDLLSLFETMETPLSGVLARMEMAGVKLDLKFLAKLSEKLGKDLDRLTRDIHQEAGEEFNINSTKQLGEILFSKMKLPIVRRTKTGYSTDVNVLEKLAQDHKVPQLLLEFREKSKLKSTYFDALPEMVNPHTGLVHTSYHQTVTATGRLSSSEPNLQNIPIKTETGREIRKGFIPRAPGRKILSADYSQIELRILAHLAEDENLIQAFLEDRDVHTLTATILYGVKDAEVTWEMRNTAKTINFSILYGKTAFGLSQDLHVSISEADDFIEAYFNRYPRVRDYLETQKEKARTQGYLTTIVGRRSYFPEIQSRNIQLRNFAERAAINAPIQGSAADLIKLAMIVIDRELTEGSFETVMTMQVHDELVFDLLVREEKKVLEIVQRGMEGVWHLKVPLKVKLHVQDSWYKD